MNRRNLFRALSSVPFLGAVFVPYVAVARTDVPLDAAEDELTLLICFRRVWKNREVLKLSDAYEVRNGKRVFGLEPLSLARMLIELAQEQGEFGDSPERRELFAQIDGVALNSMPHPDGLIDEMADAIRSGKLRA